MHAIGRYDPVEKAHRNQVVPNAQQNPNPAHHDQIAPNAQPNPNSVHQNQIVANAHPNPNERQIRTISGNISGQVPHPNLNAFELNNIRRETDQPEDVIRPVQININRSVDDPPDTPDSISHSEITGIRTIASNVRQRRDPVLEINILPGQVLYRTNGNF